MLHALLGLAAIACFQRQLPATTCIIVPPCERVRVASVLFVGTVVDPGVSSGDKADVRRDVRFQVDEIFEGLPPATKEVVVSASGSWLVKGHRYLMDEVRGEDGHLYPTICGASGDVTEGPTAETLGFLRERAAGKASTSLSVRVTDQRRPMIDANVTISGSAGRLTTRTGADGIAMFSGIKPSNYAVSATREHYQPDDEGFSTSEVNVVAGTCPRAFIALRADSTVHGRIVDSKGEAVKELEIELVTAPDDPSEEISERAFFRNDDGRGRTVRLGFGIAWEVHSWLKYYWAE